MTAEQNFFIITKPRSRERGCFVKSDEVRSVKKPRPGGRGFFINLPQGKTTGFCQPPNSSVWKDGGIVVRIKKDCKLCSVDSCMMFENDYDEDGNVVGKKYIKHNPEY